MKPEYILMAVTFAGLFLAAVISQQVKRRKGRGGGDLARLQDIAAKQLDDSGRYTIAYACCSQVKLSVGRPVTTTYFSYIVVCDPAAIFRAGDCLPPWLSSGPGECGGGADR